MMTDSSDFTAFENEVLSVIAFEFSVNSYAESERKLKRRLREKKLGAFDEERVATIRHFKDDLQRELGKCKRSEFFAGGTGKFSDAKDWHANRLLEHMKKKHPSVSAATIESFLPYAIYIYYLR